MKMKKLDISIMIMFLAALLLLTFLWECKYDPIVTALGFVVLLESAIMTYFQNKKIKDMEDKVESLRD